MNKFFRIITRIEKVEKKFSNLLLILMSLVVIAQVISRYIFNYSFVWAEEFVRYLMIWMVMIGAALVQSKNDHIRIDFFPLLAGPRGKRIMETLFRLCTLLFLIILFYMGIKMVYFSRLFESPGLRINMVWANLAIPLGALLMGLYTLSALIRDIYRLVFWSAEKLYEEDQRLAEEKYQTKPTPQQEDSARRS